MNYNMNGFMTSQMHSFADLMIVVITIGTLHMIAPDHWLPLSAISGRFKYTRARTQGTASLLGFLHSGISVVIGLAASIIGLLFISYLKDGFTLIGRILLIIVAAYFIVNGYRESISGEESAGDDTTVRSALAVSIFPDFAIVPFIFSTLGLSNLSAIEIIVSFIVVSILSINVMAYIGTRGLARIVEKIPPYYIDYVMGIILLATIPFV